MSSPASVAKASRWQAETDSGGRFRFGRNWSHFLHRLEDEDIVEAKASLKQWLETESLADVSFLDIGCGSGLFSLGARKLGAAVHSFDYDPDSVECARELQRCYSSEHDHWTIERGSILDPDFVKRLGKYDIVYAWGVLHHTGDLWRAMEHAAIPVKPGGKLFVAIYNDQGLKSRMWRAVKRFYNSGRIGRVLVCLTFIPYWVARGLVVDSLRFRNPIARYRRRGEARAMRVVTDWFDWLGGYPFEVARPEQVFDFYKQRGFKLARLKTVGGRLGNNQFVFVR